MNPAGILGLLLLLVSLAVIPGPSDLLVAGSAVRRGYRSAVYVTLGILLADVIFILAVVCGASVALDYFNRYEDLLIWASAAVLIAFGFWMLGLKVNRVELNPEQKPKLEFSFGAGFAITFFDPKALAFYFGVLPTFFDIETFSAVDTLVLTLLVSAVICVTKAFYASIAVSGVKLLPTPKAQSLLLKAIGTALILTGGWRLLS